MATQSGKQYELEIDGIPYRVRIEELTAERARVQVNDRVLDVAIRAPAGQPAPAATPAVAARPSRAPAGSPEPARPAGSKDNLDALMPGVVLRLNIKVGDQVAPGDVLLVLEAMKMENEIRSDRSGTITKIHVSVGQQVQTGDPLVSFG